MKAVKIYRIEDFKEIEDLQKPYVIVGEPCEELFELQKRGYVVLVQLKHLQGLSEEETADALCHEPAVMQYPYVCIDAQKLPKAYFQRIWYQFHKEAVIIGETEHLRIRESVEQDAEAFYKLYQDRECQKYLELPAVCEQSVEAYREYIKNYKNAQYTFYEYGMWTVLEKSSGDVVGRIGLENQYIKVRPLAEETEEIALGYALLPQFRKKGYALEACMEILRYCRECDYAQTIYVKIAQQNKDSKRLYEKLMDYAASIGLTLVWNRQENVYNK